jgi:hypothetical protein
MASAATPLVAAPSDPARPRVRAECVNGPRPCPWTTCRHHLGADALETCALDVAERGELDVCEVARLLKVHPSRVIEIEAGALRKLARIARRGAIEQLRPSHEVQRGVRPFEFDSDELDEATDAAIRKYVREEESRREQEKTDRARALGWFVPESGFAGNAG